MGSERLGDASGGLALVAVAWLLTYVCHSTLLLGSAWVVTRRRGWIGDVLRERIWKLALIGGVVSASIQTGLGWSPWAGSLILAGTEVEAYRPGPPNMGGEAGWRGFEPLPPSPSATHKQALPTAAHAEHAGADLASTGEVGNARRAFPPGSPRETGIFSMPIGQGEVSATGVSTPASVGDQTGPGWLLLVSVLLFALIALGLWRFGREWFRLQVRLARREEIVDGPLPAIVQRICRRGGLRRRVRLTCSERISAPIAIGLLRPEICLPPLLSSILSHDELECAVAHEVAHLSRRDPFWLVLSRLLEHLFFFQPLNRLARHRLQMSAEYACDHWAARQTHGGLVVARCLAKVAKLMLSSPRAPLAVAGLAQSESILGLRIERLLSPAPGNAHQIPTPWLMTIGLAVVTSLAAMAPGVVVSARPAERIMVGQAGQNGPATLNSGAAAADLAVLDLELSELVREVSLLRRDVERLPHRAALQELLERVAQKAHGIRCQRDRLISLAGDSSMRGEALSAGLGQPTASKP